MFLSVTQTPCFSIFFTHMDSCSELRLLRSVFIRLIFPRSKMWVLTVARRGRKSDHPQVSAFCAVRRQYDRHWHQYHRYHDVASVSRFKSVETSLTLTPNYMCRIYAMYEGRRWVIAFVTAVFFVEFGVNAWLMTHGIGTKIRALR